MLDVAVAYNRYRFLGNEFLTWLWFMIDNQQEQLQRLDPELTSLEIGNRIDLENRRNENIEKISIRGDDADLREGYVALKKGALACDLNLVYRSQNNKWQFNLKGESLNISSLRTPETAPPENENEMEAAVLEKIYLHQQVARFVETAFRQFVHLRTSEKWAHDTALQIQDWLASA